MPRFTRLLASAVLLSVAVTASRSADEKDPIKEKLFAAKVAYDKEMSVFRKAAGDWFDKREEVARKAGDKKTLDQNKVDRKAFDEDGVLPKAAPAMLGQKPAAARKALEAAYTQAVKDYTKAKKDDEAAAVEKELQEFLKSSGPAWAAVVAPGTYSMSYGGEATVELRKDGTFTRSRKGNNKQNGTVSLVDGKVVFKADEYIEVWAVEGGVIKVAHFWPISTYPNGKVSADATATRVKE